MIGPITPHKRLCGAVFLLVALFVVPNADFAMTLAESERAGNYAMWVAYAAYAGSVFLPIVRNVSPIGSYVSLGVSALVLLIGYGSDAAIKHGLARAVGLFDDVIPAWLGPDEGGKDFRVYVHPSAGYRMRIPSAWVRRDGPAQGLSEFVLRDSSGIVAELRPHCDDRDMPLPVKVWKQMEFDPATTHLCANWRTGFDACLLRRPVVFDGTPGEQWDWLAQHRRTGKTILLTFLLYRPEADVHRQVEQIIGTVMPGDPSAMSPICPTSVEWGTF